MSHFTAVDTVVYFLSCTSCLQFFHILSYFNSKKAFKWKKYQVGSVSLSSISRWDWIRSEKYHFFVVSRSVPLPIVSPRPSCPPVVYTTGAPRTVFLGQLFCSIYCVLGLESWLLVTVNFNLVARPQLDDSPHLRGLLCSCCLSGSLICPISDLARGPVWCLKSQVVQYLKIGGRGEGAVRNFNFWLKSISGCFSNVMVKCQLILINLRGWNYWFSFRNFNHFFKMSGLCFYWFKSIFECSLSVLRKFHTGVKSLSIFNNGISFVDFGGPRTF